MSHRPFKDALYAEFATLTKAMANPHRLELLDLLAQGERSVEDLANEAALTITNASSHLQVLRRARLVEADKRGLYVVYRLAGSDVFALWQALRNVGAARLAEVDRLVDRYLHDRARLEAIDADELLDRLTSEAVTVIDVRPEIEYRQGHIAGARSIPVDELELRLAELPREGVVIAYCRGPYCVFADEAVALLQQYGLRAARLREGYPDWKAAGLPTSVEA